MESPLLVMSLKNITIVVVCGLLAISCADDDTKPQIPGIGLPPANSRECKVNEMEFRNEDDLIIGIREFDFNINQNNRIESVSIVEGINQIPVNLRFQFYYNGDESIVPNRIDEVLGGDVLSSINFRFSEDGNLTEFTQTQVSNPEFPPESHLFYYEESELANDSINTRIIIFDIEQLTRDWIDVFPAIFTTGQQRISRFEKVTFRGDLIEFCDFRYNEQGFLEGIVCRTRDGILSEVWDFTYQSGLLISAFKQLPNFRAITDYEYNDERKPITVVSTSDGRFNWKGSYFYLCQ